MIKDKSGEHQEYVGLDTLHQNGNNSDWETRFKESATSNFFDLDLHKSL